jgi:hypothetical protein
MASKFKHINDMYGRALVSELDDESLMPKSLNKHGVPDEKNNV